MAGFMEERDSFSRLPVELFEEAGVEMPGSGDAEVFHGTESFTSTPAVQIQPSSVVNEVAPCCLMAYVI